MTPPTPAASRPTSVAAMVTCRCLAARLGLQNRRERLDLNLSCPRRSITRVV